MAVRKGEAEKWLEPKSAVSVSSTMANRREPVGPELSSQPVILYFSRVILPTTRDSKICIRRETFFERDSLK